MSANGHNEVSEAIRKAADRVDEALGMENNDAQEGAGNGDVRAQEALRKAQDALSRASEKIDEVLGTRRSGAADPEAQPEEGFATAVSLPEPARHPVAPGAAGAEAQPEEGFATGVSLPDPADPAAPGGAGAEVQGP